MCVGICPRLCSSGQNGRGGLSPAWVKFVPTLIHDICVFKFVFVFVFVQCYAQICSNSQSQCKPLAVVLELDTDVGQTVDKLL